MYISIEHWASNNGISFYLGHDLDLFFDNVTSDVSVTLTHLVEPHIARFI